MLTFALALAALPAYPDFLPAAPGEGRCGTCHVNAGGGGARNSFGTDVEATLAADGPDWSAVFCMDSDADGKTNGEELGDPCGVWARGDVPARSDDVTRPADEASTTAATGECDGAAAPACPRAGCSAGPTASLPVLAAFLLVARRSRSRSGRPRALDDMARHRAA